jgi:hypothetical protein
MFLGGAEADSDALGARTTAVGEKTGVDRL